MQIYNADAVKNKSGFIKAVIAGIVVSVICGIAYGLLIQLVHMQISLLYIAIGYVIGTVIQKTGYGLTMKYQITGALLTFLAIWIGDTFAIYGTEGSFMILTTPSAWYPAMQMCVITYLSGGINALPGIMFRIIGVWFGYHYSVIL